MCVLSAFRVIVSMLKLVPPTKSVCTVVRVIRVCEYARLSARIKMCRKRGHRGVQ